MHLSELGFKQSLNDPCIYNKQSVIDNSFMYPKCWWLILSNHESEMIQINNNLNDRFKMRDLGEVKYYLGFEFHVEHGIISMSQSKYIEHTVKTPR